MALGNFQLPYGQNIQGQVNQIFGDSGEAYAWCARESPVNNQDLAGIRPANVFQLVVLPGTDLNEVQGGNSQPIISNVHTLESRRFYYNLVSPDAQASTRNQLQIPLLGPIESVYGHAVDQLSSEYIALSFSNFL